MKSACVIKIMKSVDFLKKCYALGDVGIKNNVRKNINILKRKNITEQLSAFSETSL